MTFPLPRIPFAAPAVLLVPAVLAFGPRLAVAPPPGLLAPQETQDDPAKEKAKDKDRGEREGIEVKRPWTPAPIESESDVAFWIRLEGSDAPPIAVTVEEWNRYFEELYRVYPVEDHISMTYRIFQGMLDAKLVQLLHHDTFPAVLERAEEVIKRLERGTSWERVVRQYSDDTTSKTGGGYQGPYKRQLQRYPLETDLFQLEAGEVSGPYLTKYGVEFFRCESHTPERGTTAESVDVSYLVLTLGKKGIGRLEWPELRRRLRLTTSHEFFRAILPPGMMEASAEGPSFGPTDVAPVGSPNVPLQMVLTGAPIFRPEANGTPAPAGAERQGSGG